MTTSWNTLLHVLNTMPAWLAAVLVGWAISVGFTQGLKFALPVRWCPDGRELTARIVAFLSAALPAWLYYAGQDGAQPMAGFLVAIGSGFWSPLAFAILQAVLRRFAPWLADALSGDKRGVVAAKLKGQGDAR